MENTLQRERKSCRTERVKFWEKWCVLILATQVEFVQNHLTWHVVGHATALPQGDVREALHVAVLLRVLLVEAQVLLLGEVAASPVRVVVLQPHRRRHHVGLHNDHDLLVQRRPEVLHADAGNFTGVVQQDLPQTSRGT